MQVKEALTELAAKMNEQPEGIAGVHTTYQFDLSDEECSYQVIFQDNQVSLSETIEMEPNCTLQLSANNLLKLIGGNLNPTIAYMSGKLKIKGELGQALKLQAILKRYE